MTWDMAIFEFRPTFHIRFSSFKNKIVVFDLVIVYNKLILAQLQ